MAISTQVLFFVGAKSAAGRVRVEVFEDAAVAAVHYQTLRLTGFTGRTLLGRGLPGDDRTAVVAKATRFLAEKK